MSAESRHIAIDLGASSGRVALGTVRDGKLEVEILHRFQNGGVPVKGGLYWDILGLWREILHGLKLAGQRGDIASVGVDSWAVDYALLDDNDELLGNPHHYRSPRLNGVMEQVREKLGDERIYRDTGIQFLPFNTLYQLAAEPQERLRAAKTFLMIPDLLHFWLSGEKAAEQTNASSTQFYGPVGWNHALLAQAGIPHHFLPEYVVPGRNLGPLTEEVQRETGLTGTRVIVPATHDTASAVAAVPVAHWNPLSPDWAYISSGTWSLVGMELLKSVRTEQARAFNLTNEAGVNGTTRLLKNVMGLWIVQECRRAWEADFATLYADAARVPARGPLIDPDDARFLHPGTDMPQRVQAYCAETAQTVPRTQAEIVRCVLDSLAHRTAEVLEQLEQVTGNAIQTVYIVGGGSQGTLLNQLTADLTGRTVIAGPVEATLIGNLLVQAEACGSIPPGTLRDVVRASETLTTFTPSGSQVRAERERFRRVTQEKR